MRNNLFLMLTCLLCTCSFNLYAQTVDSTAQDGELFVIIKSDSQKFFDDYDGKGLPSNPNLIPFVNMYGLSEISRPFKQFKGPTCQRTYKFEFTKIGLVNNFIKALQTINYIESVEKIPIGHIALTPNDPFFNSGNYHPQNWHLLRIGADNAWNINQGSTNVQIAVIDNEIDYQHPDLFANIHENPSELPVSSWPNSIDGPPTNTYVDDLYGWDFADSDLNTTGNNILDHGTHCAGLVSGVTNNSIGISSIGNTCEIIPVKISSNSSHFPTSIDPTAAITAIYYAVDNGAEVISCSWTMGASMALQNAIIYADNNGVVVVAAAGNSNNNFATYPASYATVIAVAATDPNDEKASFSNFGNWVDICAPGTNIFSTNSRLIPNTVNGYSYKSGTSMACPIVAGLCGLILSQNPTFTPAQVLNCLQSTATNIDGINPTYAGQLGSGRINAPQALLCANNNQSVFFTADHTNACMNQTINLSGISNATGILGWNWSFIPAPTTITPGPTSQNVSVTFANATQVTVTLTVNTTGGPLTYTANNFLDINAPTANFVSPTTSPICNGSPQSLVIGFQDGAPPFTYTISNGYTNQTLVTSTIPAFIPFVNTMTDYFYFNADPNHPNYTISSITDANGCTSINNSTINLTIIPCCANLIDNGDFEQGNTPSINSDDTIVCGPTAGGLDGEGCASVMDNNGSLAPTSSCQLHVGNMPVPDAKNLYFGVNGRKGSNQSFGGIIARPLPFSTPAINVGFSSRLWFQENVNVTASSQYNIDFFTKGASGDVGLPALLKLEVVDSLDTVIFTSGNFVSPAFNADWHQFSYSWNNTTYTGPVEVRISQVNYFSGWYYDFGFDDISMRKTNIAAGNGGAYAGQDITICAGASAQLSGSGGPSYSWAPGSYTVAQPTVTPTTTTTYTLTTNNPGCGTSVDTVYVYVIPYSCTATNTVAASTYTGGTPNFGLGTPTSIAVNGNIIFASGVNTIDCNDITMGPNIKMTVKDGATLNIRDAWLHGCSGCHTMWEGIDVEEGGTLLINNYSIIEDANNAVKTIASASTGIPNLQINNTIFNKNNKAIYFFASNGGLDFTPAAGNIVKNCIFTSRVLPTATTSANFNTIKNVLYNDFGTYPTVNMLNGYRSSAGFWFDGTMFNANCYEIGVAGTNTSAGVGNVNVFDNLDFGIRATGGDFLIRNNLFINLTGNSATSIANGNPYGSMPFGVGICSSSKGGNGSVGIGGGASGATADGQNTFKNCNRAAELFGYNFAYIYSNVVTNNTTSPIGSFQTPGYYTGQYGFYLNPKGTDATSNIQVKGNEITNAAYGIHINRSGSYLGDNYRLECNTITSDGTPTKYLKKGIYLQDAVGSTTGMPQYGINVRYNNITFAEEQALLAENIRRGLDISGNEEWSVKYNATPNALPNTIDVIRLNNCEGVKIETNPILTTSGGNTLLANGGITGVYINNSSANGNNNIVDNNNINHVGSCVVWAGNNPTGTLFRGNVMENSVTGLYMYTNAAFNTQGATNSPTGNRWGTTGSGSLIFHTVANSGANVNNSAKIYVKSPSGSGSLTGVPIAHFGFPFVYTTGVAVTNGIIETGGTEPTFGVCPDCGCGGGDPQGISYNQPEQGKESLMKSYEFFETSLFTLNRLAFDNTRSGLYDSERKWYDKYAAMTILVRDNNAIKTEELNNFYHNTDNSSLKSFAMTDEYIERGSFEMARKELSGIVPQNDIESKLYFVNEQIILANLDQLDADNTTVLNQLFQLGNECSFVSGPAVYKARSLYNSLVKGGYSFTENCTEQTPSIVNESGDQTLHSAYFNLYPNPNNGKMTIEYDLEENVNAELFVYDINGRIVWKKYVDPAIHIDRIEIGDVADGIYMYKLVVNGETIESNRFIIVK